MGRSVSHLSDVATQQTNVTGQLTPILEIDPENGTLLRFLNKVSQGDAVGIPIITDLRDANGNPLPTDTELLFRVDRPTDDDPRAVSVKEPNIASWNSLSTAEQRNEDNIDSTKVELKGAAVNIRDKDTLRIEVNSSAQIDWSQSELYFIREAVEELPFDG